MCSCSAMAPNEGAAEHTHASRSLASWQRAVPSYSAATKTLQAGNPAVRAWVWLGLHNCTDQSGPKLAALLQIASSNNRHTIAEPAQVQMQAGRARHLLNQFVHRCSQGAARVQHLCKIAQHPDTPVLNRTAMTKS